jgi:oxidoreductase
MHLKGCAEEAVTKRSFAHASIFRPGMLDRGDKERTLEKLVGSVLPKTHVAAVARAMISVAERTASGVVDPSPTPVVYETPDIKDVAAAAALKALKEHSPR